MPDSNLPRLAVFLPSLRCGGAERMMLNVVRGLCDRQIPVDLLLAKAEGELLVDVPAAARVVDFGAAHVRNAVTRLAAYLRRERPHGVVSRLSHANLGLLAANLLARTNTRTVVVEASNLSANLAAGRLRRELAPVMRWLYPRAGAIVAVSQGVADDLTSRLRLPPSSVRVIYNPVIDAAWRARLQRPAVHRWIGQTDIPLYMTVGRLDPAKDHETLLRAFALVRASRPARLIILGEGPLRGRLKQLAAELGMAADVDLPGYCDHPQAMLRHASAFVLSSRFEGLPNALIEALACGVPVVSTDCPSGPAEILRGGQYGVLVPPGDAAALAGGMLAVLTDGWDTRTLRARGEEFSIERALPQFLDALAYPLSGVLTAAA